MKTVTPIRQRPPWLLLLMLFLVVASCDNGEVALREYQIVVNGTSTPVPVRFTGSYAYVTEGAEYTHDLSGTGSFSTSFQGSALIRVRLQLSSGTGLAAMTVYENGEVIFDSSPTDALNPIIFTNTQR